MSEIVRPEVSTKNEYYIDKHRYYELKHFCLQYPSWTEALRNLDGWGSVSVSMVHQPRHDGRRMDQTGRTVEARLAYENYISIVKQAADMTDKFFAPYILTAVTNGFTFDHLRARTNIPCCRKNFYAMYRKFFWMLDKLRG